MRTVKIYFLILSLALAMASVSHLPANQAGASETYDDLVFLEVANVAKDPRDLPRPLNRSNPGTVTVNLYAQEVIAEIAPGERAWVWTFAGTPTGAFTVPGPMIRAMEGDTIVINLTNNMAGNIEPHNIDFHASMGPGGGATVTDVEPGETVTFSFKALRNGAFIYHCAGEGMAWEHIAYGMYGLIMVEPPGGLKSVDKEFYIGQGDWYFKPAGEGEKHGIPSDVLVLDEDLASDERPTMYSFNGHKNALTDPGLFGEAMRVTVGSTVRFFFVTGGPNIGSNFHVIGTIFDKVYKGHYMDFTRNEETLYVPPGSAAVIELSTPVPGKYLIVDHAIWRVPKGTAGFMHVDDPFVAWPHDIYSPNPADMP